MEYEYTLKSRVARLGVPARLGTGERGCQPGFDTWQHLFFRRMTNFGLLVACTLVARAHGERHARLPKEERTKLENLALEFLKADDLVRAAKLFKLAIEHAPRNTNLRCNLAVTLMRMGNGPKSRVEWERLYTHTLRQYHTVLAIDPLLGLAIEGAALTKSNVRLRTDLVGGSILEAEMLIASALGEHLPDDFVPTDSTAAEQIAGSPHIAAAAALEAGGTGVDEYGGEGDDVLSEHGGDDLFGTGNVVEVGGDPMMDFLESIGVEKWHSALVEYGIDELAFLREIEEFDMQYIGMPEADQTKILAALKLESETA